MAEGDEKAFEEVFNMFQRKVYAYILKITGTAEIAEDGLQDIFLKIWQNRSKLTEIENFNAYVHRMAYNYAYSGFRNMAKEALVLAELKKNSTVNTIDPENLLLTKEVKAQIQALVDQLTPQQREVFRLSREGGLKHEEIAKQLGISVLTVKKHMSLALKVLREEIINRYGILVFLFIKF